jgi:hypothetical protein
MNAVAALFILLAAQDVPLGEARLPVRLGDDQAGEPRPTLTIVQRFSVPDGGLGGGADYEDFFDLGYGLSVEFDYLLDAGMNWRWGPYFSLGWDFFDGQEETINGVELDAESLKLFNVLVGLKGLYQVDKTLFLELHGGVGFTHFLSTDADLSAGGGSVELLEASTEIAALFGMRTGFNLGKLMKIDFGAGVCVRGSAEEGEVPVNPHSMIQYFIDLGVGFRF